MITCSLIGLTVAATVPNLRSYRESQRVWRASEQVAAACREARARARSENHNVFIEYRTDENALAIVNDVNNNGVADSGEQVQVRPLAEGMSLQSTTFPNDRLLFDSRGRAVAGGSVRLGGAEGVQPKSVRVAAGTGQVRVRSCSDGS